jgi:hypothetical protein
MCLPSWNCLTVGLYPLFSDQRPQENASGLKASIDDSRITAGNIRVHAVPDRALRSRSKIALCMLLFMSPFQNPQGKKAPL